MDAFFLHKREHFMQVFYYFRKKALSLPRNFYNSFRMLRIIEEIDKNEWREYYTRH